VFAASGGWQTQANPPIARDANLALIEAYTYDATGNRLTQQMGANPVTTYSYPAQSHHLIQVGTVARSFDAAGNTLTGVPGYEADSATYDARNRLTQVGSGSSAQLLSNYNGRGARVLVSQGAPAPALPTTSAAWTTAAGVRGYVYDESGQVISMLIAGSPQRYEEIIWLDHTPIGRVESSTSAVIAVHVIHSDHLNTPRALANAQTQGGQPPGTVVWRWKLNQQTATGSNAFGAQPTDEDPDGNGTSVRFDLRFPGQQYDAATGLHYNYFRDYEPETGRYVESDPIGLGGGVSTFLYVTANPVLLVDPLGLAEINLARCNDAEIAAAALVAHPNAITITGHGWSSDGQVFHNQKYFPECYRDTNGDHIHVVIPVSTLVERVRQHPNFDTSTHINCFICGCANEGPDGAGPAAQILADEIGRPVWGSYGTASANGLTGPSGFNLQFLFIPRR
jgi:RHS repeat-associated protein